MKITSTIVKLKGVMDILEMVLRVKGKLTKNLMHCIIDFHVTLKTMFLRFAELLSMSFL